jgi:hypothetical protein
LQLTVIAAVWFADHVDQRQHRAALRQDDGDKAPQTGLPWPPSVSRRRSAAA